MGDLLQRASTDQKNKSVPQKAHPANRQNSANTQNTQNKKAVLDMHLLARSIEQRVAADLWRRYQIGERGIFNRSLYTVEGQNTFDEVYHRYNSDTDFMGTVDNYLNDFERLLREADQKDPRGQLVQNYLTLRNRTCLPPVGSR